MECTKPNTALARVLTGLKNPTSGAAGLIAAATQAAETDDQVKQETDPYPLDYQDWELVEAEGRFSDGDLAMVDKKTAEAAIEADKAEEK